MEPNAGIEHAFFKHSAKYLQMATNTFWEWVYVSFLSVGVCGAKFETIRAFFLPCQPSLGLLFCLFCSWLRKLDPFGSPHLAFEPLIFWGNLCFEILGVVDELVVIVV